MKRTTLIIVLLLAAAAHAEEQLTNPALQEQLQEVSRQLVRSGIPEDEAQTTVRAMIRARFTVEQVVRAGKQMASDDRRGITGQAVRDKIHEGVAKGVPPENILSAAEKVRSRLEYSAKLAVELHETNTMSVVTAYADCLAAGLTEQHAHQLTNAIKARAGTPGNSSSQSLTMETLLTAREMVRRNISSATTVGVLESALARSYNGEEMRSLRKSLAGSSGDPENTARHFGTAIDQGARAGELQGLGKSGSGTGERSGMGMGQGASGSSSDSSGSSGNSGGSNESSGSSGGGSGGSGGSGGGGGGRH